MKITKSELKKIIKEEIEATNTQQLNENPAAIIGAITKFGPMIMKLVDIISKNPEIIDNLAGLVTSAGSGETKPDVSPASE